MYLFKVIGKDRKDGQYSKVRYITAIDEATAVAKFVTIPEVSWCLGEIVSIKLCERDSIIPTVEPKVEFANH